jgi:hypothetical protein
VSSRHFDKMVWSETVESEVRDSGITIDESRPPGVFRFIDAESEQDRTRRRSVHPLEVIYNHHDGLTITLQPIEKIHEASPYRHRVCSQLRRVFNSELIENAIGEERLCLVTTHLEDDRIGDRADELGEEGRFSSPRLGLYEDDSRMTRSGSAELFVENAQFLFPANEIEWATHVVTSVPVIGKRRRASCL